MRTTAALLLQVLRCALAVEAGASAGAAVSQARPPVFGRRKDLVQAALRRWRVPEVTAALAMLRAAEAASRTRRSPTALICRHTLTSLARLPRPGAA